MIAVDHVTRIYGGSLTAVDDVTEPAPPHVGGAVVGRGETNDDPQGGRLSGAVGTRQPGDPPRAGGEQELPNPGLEVGMLLDASAQHAGRPGRDVLAIAQATMGLPRQRAEVLDVVGLSETRLAGQRARSAGRNRVAVLAPAARDRGRRRRPDRHRPGPCRRRQHDDRPAGRRRDPCSDTPPRDALSQSPDAAGLTHHLINSGSRSEMACDGRPISVPGRGGRRGSRAGRSVRRRRTDRAPRRRRCRLERGVPGADRRHPTRPSPIARQSSTRGAVA
jgi:hypothetical protein